MTADQAYHCPPEPDDSPPICDMECQGCKEIFEQYEEDEFYCFACRHKRDRDYNDWEDGADALSA